jgi:hypothetical protein
MPTQIGTGHIVSLTGATLAKSSQGWTTFTGGYVSPNMQSLRVTHNAEVDRIKGQTGKYTGLVGDGEMLECEFTVIPEGTNSGNAKISATLPQVLECFAISGLPIIAMGEFQDSLNTNASNTQPWVYEGGGSVNLTNTEKATLTLPLKRYPAILLPTKIT